MSAEQTDACEFADATAEGGFAIDGYLFGCGTNIFSIYGDPELEATWQRVNLKEAHNPFFFSLKKYSLWQCLYIENVLGTDF